MSRSSRRRILAFVVGLALVLPVFTVSTPSVAAVGESWDLDPTTGRPYDFQSYPQPTGWQSNPSSPTAWGFWPVCTGVLLDTGSPYTGGRSKYCLQSVSVRRAGDSQWTKMTPQVLGPAPRAPGWSTDWSTGSGRNGLGGLVVPSTRTVNSWLGIDLWDGQTELDASVEYRAEVNIGTFDMVAMRSIGAGGAYSQETNAAGDNILTVSSRPGARSVMIPPTDVCTNPTATATASYKAAWSVTLFDRKLFSRYAPYDGAILESDAYPSSVDYFPMFDSNTGSFSIKVCAPHYKADGSLNVGYYRLVLSRAMLERAGYFISDPKGNPVTDGRTLSQATLVAMEEKVLRDFQISSTTQTGIRGVVKLLVAADGEISVEIAAEVSYSSPTITVSRNGPAAWRGIDNSEQGGYVAVKFKTSAKVSGTLYAELRSASGKLVSKTTKVVKSTTGGGASVDVPKSARAGKYVLKVYVVGAKVKGKAKTTPIQSLPVAVTKGG